MTWLTLNEFSRCYFCMEFSKFNDTAPQPRDGRKKNIFYSSVYIFGYCIVQINCAWCLCHASPSIIINADLLTCWMLLFFYICLQMQQCLVLPLYLLSLLIQSCPNMFYEFQHVISPACSSLCPSIILLAMLLYVVGHNVCLNNSGTGTHPNGKH